MLRKHFSAHQNTVFHHQSTVIDEIPGPQEEADELPPIFTEAIELAVNKMKDWKTGRLRTRQSYRRDSQIGRE